MFFYSVEAGRLEALGRKVLDLVILKKFAASRQGKKIPRSGNGLERGRPARLSA
jgi:hypothetical protein